MISEMGITGSFRCRISGLGEEIIECVDHQARSSSNLNRSPDSTCTCHVKSRLFPLAGYARVEKRVEEEGRSDGRTIVVQWLLIPPLSLSVAFVAFGGLSDLHY
jgi:hypothetical protein